MLTYSLHCRWALLSIFVFSLSLFWRKTIYLCSGKLFHMHVAWVIWMHLTSKENTVEGNQKYLTNPKKKKKSHDWGCRVVTWLIVYLQDKRIYSNDLPSWGFRQVGSSIQESTTHACAVTCIYPCNLCPQVPVISPVSDHVFYMKEFRCIRPPVQDSFERKKAKPQDS
jgi:hypothetical protein